MTSEFDSLERRLDQAYGVLVDEVRLEGFERRGTWSMARDGVVSAIVDLVGQQPARDRLVGRFFAKWYANPQIRARVRDEATRREVMADITSILGRAMAEEISLYDGERTCYPHWSILAQRERYEGAGKWHFTVALDSLVGNPFKPERGGLINRAAYKELKESIWRKTFGKEDAPIVEELPDPKATDALMDAFAPEAVDDQLANAVEKYVRATLRSKPRQCAAVLAYLENPFAAVESGERVNLRLGINNSVVAFLEDFLRAEEDALRALVAVVRAKRGALSNVSSDDLDAGVRSLSRLPLGAMRQVVGMMPRSLVAAWIRNATIIGGVAAGTMAAATASATMMV